MTETDDEAQRRREECERKARRGEMDPRLEFTFQLLIDGTALPRHQLMDYIFEGDMLDEINQLFLPNMKNKLLWFYQEVDEPETQTVPDANKPGPSRAGGVSTSSKTPQGVSPSGSNPKPKKLFLTDGWTCAFTGVCIYIFRINTSKQLPEEGFQKDLYCGVIDAKNIGLVTSIERIVEYVFMQALAFPSLEGDDEDVSCGLIKGQLLPGLRSFCSALRVCEQVCDHYNVFADGAGMFEKIDEIEEVKEMAKNQEFCLQLEERVANWIKAIMKILGESEQLRMENDHSGPQDELEYWKKRGAQFSQLLAHLQDKEVQFTLHCLFLAGSRIMRHWKITDRKITFCYNEARDNSKFIQAMESCCHSLYLDDPVCMKESILSLLQTVRLIYSVSQFYNTSERTSALMVKITNQMIETCKSYITCRSKETIWSQDRNVIRTKLGNCIKLNHIYHETYYTVREQPFLPNQTPFGFSENFVFGKFDTFCDRLSKIISMFNLIDDYNHLFERRLEGLLLGEALEEASTAFEEAKKEILSKKYDYLDHRNSDFNEDFDRFIGKTDTLKDTIASLIETNFDTVWETPQCIRFLVRFEKVSEKIPLSKMDDKYQRILKYCDKEIDRILKLFRKQRDDPPVPRNFPPIAGRLRWCRALDCHLNELMMEISDHLVLQTLPLTKDLENKYKSVQGILMEYEKDIISIWLDQDVSVADACLIQPVLCLQGERLFVNLHPTIPLLIREAKALAKLDVELPIVAATLMCRQNYFTTIQDSLNSLIKMFLTTVKAVKLEVRPLFLPQLVRLTAMLQPGLSTINWTHHNWTEFYERCKQAIETFEVLVARVHDIYSNRILNVLMSMQDVSLQILPCDDEIWTVDEFLEKSEEACRKAAIELNRKSQMVSEAVEEVLSLVDKATATFKEIAGNDVVTLFDATPKDQQSSAKSSGDKEGNQQQDWSILWSCFENPLSLLSTSESLPKGMQDMVCNAVVEMRRYYSRKVIDVLIKVIRAALDMIRRRFIPEDDINSDTAVVSKKPILALNAILMIPHVTIKPSIDELQEMVITVGKNITGISKGVAQWTSGRDSQLATNTVNPRVSRHQPDDKRGRRRKIYCLASEERPQMPHMLKSFYSSIMDNKEVVRALSLLSNCTKNVKPEIQAYIKRWKPYHFLWKNDRTTRQLMEFGLQEFETSLRCLAELDANLLVEPDIEVFGQCIAVYNERLKYGLAIEIKTCNHKIGQAMKKKYKKEMDYVYAVINEMDRKLDRSIRDLDDVRMIMETLGKIREQEVDMEMRIDPIEEAFNVLTRYEVQVEREQFDLVDNLRSTFQNLQACALQAQVKLLDMQPTFQGDLKTNLQNFRQDKIDYVNEYRNAGPMQPGLTPREASDRLILFQNRFEGMWRRLQTYQSGEELFGLPQTDYPELGQIRKELNLLQKLYKLYNDVIDRVSSYYDIPWNEVDIEEINNELMEFQNRCRKLPKGLKEWPAFHALKKTIDDFNDMCPLLELMANKAMKPRHWQRIMDVTQYIFEFDSEGFSLKNILEAPLLKHKEDIEDICISAMKEKDIEAKLKQVTNEWSVHELQFMSFNNRGELLLRGDTTAETIGQLEDSLMILGSLLSNRYNAPFRKQIQQWVYDLSNSNEILERWLLVQNMWVYLEAVFVGGDIAKQLPKEAKRFSKIDKSWQKIMQRAHETPGVVACCVGDDLLKQLLPHLQEQLEICQKSLSGYLERKRMMFPRFFFVSDPALLEILGQASDSHTIQNHLLSIFDNTRHVRFHDIEYNKMMAIMSCEGESIQLDRAIRAEGSVETWLTQLLVTAQQSLHSIIRTAYASINDPNFALVAFLEKVPAQVGLLGIQMIWTRDAEMALMQARHERKVMSETNNKFLELLNTLIDQTTRNLTKIERTNFETLITIHVHQRDIFDILCRMNIKSANDFEWLKQCRFYFKEDLDKTWISITDVTFTYQNEYLGCTDRLVITPLTDRCYITLAQALTLSMGGSPCGPAGTGKTETVKDMGKTLAKYVVVFNCSDQMDYRGLGRIYKGLSQSGTWGCFDEFNRIELPVLSVAAQQVAVVLTAKKEKKKSFVFTDGDTIEMNQEFGIFITMNPGYAGRKELPENLKIQFRTVAMMVPDRQIIIRVKLASCGFLENITLARKFYTLYKLCEEQLTKQVHYDFGLRNILSVLRTLGASKRSNSKDSESTIVMRVLRDMNLSKLIDEDEPLFMSLVSDLFPNQTLEKTNYPELETAIAQQADEAGLVYHPPWVLKLIQLYETQKVRHGIMALGPSGAGKTTCIHTLMKAMTQMGTVHREMRMNPKAITSAQMFGRLDVATNDWTDGIFSALWRKTLKSKGGENIWLVLDGPVDSIWIENLNSVLDDNKTLTLANGDRLVMAPTCKIIFEPHNIDNASPATVSRNGMVYMSSSGLDSRPIVQAWLKSRSPGEKTVFSDLFEQSFLSIFNWGTQNLKLLMSVLQCNIVQQMLFILEGLVPVKKDEEGAASMSSKDSQEGKTAEAKAASATTVKATAKPSDKAVSQGSAGVKSATGSTGTKSTASSAGSKPADPATAPSSAKGAAAVAAPTAAPAVEQSKDDNRRLSNASEGDEIPEEVKSDEKEDTCTPEHLHRLYIFSIAWGLGGYLNSADRCKLDAYVKETFPHFDYPKMKGQESTIFDFFVSPTGMWQSWKTLVTPYMYPEVSTPDYLSILVPIVDNVRIDYLIGTIANQERAVMLIGEQGTGKTVMMKNFMKKMNPESYMGRSFNFSSATSPYQFQRTIESYVEKRVGVTFGPPGGRKLIVFIDDINLPEINEWGDQITNEIVRQTMDMKGFYSLEKPGDFTTVVDVQYVGAMGLPGGGRNDIPSRLKRQFSVFNCNIPDNESIDKIFRVVGEGHYNNKRGFAPEVRNLVKKLIFITRYIWQRTRENLLPTPAKFHYVFSLRDLSRIWQGMVGTLSTVITAESVMMSLWKHECTRVFADRFTTVQDKEWFSGELVSLVRNELSEAHVEMIGPSPVFVDFMRDAPEPTGEEGEDADMELPKVYEPVSSHEVLRERLFMFLAQFNEMVRGSGMDLVFFPDAMLHLVKISRIIRHPRGNVMLVGVGGSGKQSLTKLASFIAGYKTFQISLTRSYNVANFLEDLKLLYRTCGVQGKGTTFLFSDLDIKEEGFLEYLNNILSSGVISNLFTRDEQAEIVQELTPVMKRENQRKTATPESVMEFFLARTCTNLHVAFCFSPVGETFRARVQRFPALVSGCTIDWFQPWPKDALISVAQHFLNDFEIECTPAVKKELVTALGSIQDVVSETSVEYFQRFRRATHVTPKSYLNFIAGYKNIYQQKQKELGDGVEKMDTGLEKLKEASASVEILKKDLAVMEQELVEASKKAESVLVEVTERAMQAEIVKNQVMIVKEKAEALVACIANEKALAEEKLEAAKPALEEAENALNTIKPAHIATVRKLGRPPHLIMRIMDCVLILFKRKLHPCIPDAATPCPKPSWQESLKMMASATFLLQLQNYPKDTINDEMIDLLQPYFRMEDYNMDMARRVCGDVAGLLSWTKAMGFFHSVNKEVLPLKANLTMQEARLKLAMDDLAGAEEQLREREDALQQVKNQYDKAVGEKQRLTDAANVCLRKMTAATALINGLTDEKHRWTNQSKEFKIQLGKLVGDVLLATGFLSYCGPYNQEFRTNLIKTWMTILKQRVIPFTLNLNITNMLVDSSTVSEWTLQGLPNDELSVQNALIATKSSSYPLLVDPQSQGKIWIKCKEDKNELQITSLNHKYFRTHLEDSLSLGRPLLIEDVGTELDPVIDNVLEKNFIKSGSIEKVLVGDKECDVMPGFMLYITTKLPNPAFSPEMSAKTSIIDFTVTMRGLEDQLLGRVILMEKSDLEAERVALFETVMQNQRNMKELEANLLYRLSSSQGSLVDDEALIEVLRVTKSTAEEVNQKLKISEITEKKIMKAREEYRAVAARGSILYFLITEMSNVNVMYQNSLKQFLVIFNNSITKSTKSSVTEERINIILKYLTYEVWAFTNRSLYERHKQLFTLMLAIKIDYHKGNITHEEFMAFIKGGASLDLNAVAPKPFRWILDITWLNLVEISKLDTFLNVLQIIESSEKEWRAWYEAEKPEMEDIPCGYQASLDGFRKLLLVRSWSPDRTISQAKKYIEESLGPEYSEMQILDLEATWLESEPRTPFVCLLSIGSDPTTQIGILAKQKGIPLKSVSMGQGQEFHARKMILEAMSTGGWVLLQNVHLSLPFCTEVIDLLVESEHIDDSFRMWVTTEPHSEFPIGLLQMAIKFTNEPPQGIRASMKRSYQAFSQDFLDYTSAPQWPPLLYTVAFLHTVIQERRKFGPLGWNVPYEFNQADFAASVQFIQNHLDEMDPKKGVSWQTVCYMLGEVQYGGRVTDDFDKRLLTTFTAVWFCESLLTSSFEFYKGYRVPVTKSLQGFVDYINSLPANDTPEVFGLHPNADITYQINTAKGILDTILSVQPKEGGGGGGETRESIVYQLADDMLRKLPPQYNEFEVRENLNRMGALLPMNIFLRQEIDRMQRVIKEVFSCLRDLKLAIDGTIVMSAALKESLDAMYDARIPERWMKISWESTTLGFWYTELLERNAQFRTWISTDRPKVFWMTGFFNPQGFLTAMRQEVTRAHKGWALDSVVLQNQTTRYNKEDITEYPAEGVYVHGLFLEGASLDRRSGKLIESKPKVLYEQMPVIYIYAINTTAGKDPKLYECPIYRKPQRTDAKYVGSIDFETDFNPKHWTLRGVALLCDIK
ncbi:dynein axonemal heavy chain 5 isoform X2 [Eupeodes corollae]|uniref:dynein axonemal heavy chain 5 isoform X2 n=1 Tax=Eupeodes corollae TaxID=290404 RepID=UPI002491C789|nr:dynein axonemal heavy chain 5 isoform X2 [Eupeodes corollae]